MTGVSFRIDGLDSALGKLAALARATGDVSPAMREIGKTVVDHTRLRFERGVSPEGDPWEPSQRARREHGQTLRLSGHLMASITHRATAIEVAIGTAKVYGAIHQFGGTIARTGGSRVNAHEAGGRFRSRKSASRQRGGAVRVSFSFVGAYQIEIPPRPFIGLDDADRGDIPEIVDQHLEKALRG